MNDVVSHCLPVMLEIDTITLTDKEGDLEGNQRRCRLKTKYTKLKDNNPHIYKS